MSDIRIKSEKELMRFLNLVAKESYGKAINESYLDYEDQYDFDKDRFGSLSAGSKKKLDEEEEEEEAAGLFDEPTEEPELDDQSKEPEKNAIADQEDAMTTVSFDSVIDRINTLRAGRSTKDKEIKRSLEDYYNKLDENERIVLKIFLEELSEILGGEVDGAAAKEPSDPPDSFKITSAEQGADADAKAAADATKPEEEELFPEEEEDTSPPKEDLPVAVNERNSDWELRMKIRELMER